MGELFIALGQRKTKSIRLLCWVSFVGVFMSGSQHHALRNLLMIILGGIETNNLELSKQAIRRMEKILDSCRPCSNEDSEGEN